MVAKAPIRLISTPGTSKKIIDENLILYGIDYTISLKNDFSVYEDSLLDLEKSFHDSLHRHSISEDLMHPSNWLEKVEDKMKTGELKNLFNSL